jgi:hypothetical protein
LVRGYVVKYIGCSAQFAVIRSSLDRFSGPAVGTGGAISESQTRATPAARAPNPPLISLPCVLGLDEVEKPAKAKGFLSPSETNGFASRS